MGEDDWRTVGYIGVILGVFFFIGGLGTYFYSEPAPSEPFLGSRFPWSVSIVTLYPYRGYSFGLFGAGVTLFVVV